MSPQERERMAERLRMLRLVVAGQASCLPETPGIPWTKSEWEIRRAEVISAKIEIRQIERAMARRL